MYKVLNAGYAGIRYFANTLGIISYIHIGCGNILNKKRIVTGYVFELLAMRMNCLSASYYPCA